MTNQPQNNESTHLHMNASPEPPSGLPSSRSGEGELSPESAGSTPADSTVTGGMSDKNPACPEAPSPSSLDTTETSVAEEFKAWMTEKNKQPLARDFDLDDKSWNARFWHSGWKIDRRRVFDSMKRTGQSSSRMSTFNACGHSTISQSNDPVAPKKYRLNAGFCQDRLCLPCAARRSFKIRDRLAHLLPQDKPLSFITLTLCGRGEPLKELVDKLLRSFRALRAQPLWEDSTVGGVAFIEIKWSDKALRWHPHLHIIADAKYMEVGALSGVWRGITKDSFIVDIRRVKDLRKAGQYVTKYASKPMNSSFMNSPKLLDEAVLALKGRRLCFAFGDWYGTPMATLDDEELADDMTDAAGYSMIMDLDSCICQATDGDKYCQQILIDLGLEARWRIFLESS